MWELPSPTCLPHELADNQERLILTQCNKALFHLTRRKQDSSAVLVYLVSCLLFVAVELLQSHYGSARQQVVSGCKILREWKASITDRTEGIGLILVNQIDPIFTHYALHVNEVNKNESITPSSLLTGGTFDNYSCEIPEFFLSHSHARKVLYNLLEHIFCALKFYTSSASVKSDFLSILVSDYQRTLGSWYAKLITYRSGVFQRNDGSNQACHDLTSNTCRAADVSSFRYAILLKIHFHVARIMIATMPFASKRASSHPNFEMLFDAHNSDFSEIVSLCKEYLAFEKQEHSIGAWPLKQTFSFDSGVIHPLFMTATRCRDPLTRQAAIRILSENPRQEGFCASAVAAFVAKQVRTIEEAHFGREQSVGSLY